MNENIQQKEEIKKKPKLKKWHWILISVLSILVVCGIVLGLIPVYLNGKL